MGPVLWGIYCHEVSILMTAGIGDGWWRGVEPRSKISMTIMRPPQQGQGQERASVVPGSTTVSSSISGSATASSSRIFARLFARALLAKRP